MSGRLPSPAGKMVVEVEVIDCFLTSDEVPLHTAEQGFTCATLIIDCALTPTNKECGNLSGRAEVPCWQQSMVDDAHCPPLSPSHNDAQQPIASIFLRLHCFPPPIHSCPLLAGHQECFHNKEDSSQQEFLVISEIHIYRFQPSVHG